MYLGVYAEVGGLGLDLPNLWGSHRNCRDFSDHLRALLALGQRKVRWQDGLATRGHAAELRFPPLLLLAIVYLIDTTYYADEVSGTTLVKILIGVAFSSLCHSLDLSQCRHLPVSRRRYAGRLSFSPHRATNMILGLSSGGGNPGRLGVPEVRGCAPTLWSRSSVKHCSNIQQRPTPGSTKNRETDPRFPQWIPSRVFASSPIESLA